MINGERAVSCVWANTFHSYIQNALVIIEYPLVVVVPEYVRRLLQRLGNDTLQGHLAARLHVDVGFAQNFNLWYWNRGRVMFA